MYRLKMQLKILISVDQQCFVQLQKIMNYVTVVVDPEDYPRVLTELNLSGAVQPATRRKLSCKSFPPYCFI